MKRDKFWDRLWMVILLVIGAAIMGACPWVSLRPLLVSMIVGYYASTRKWHTAIVGAIVGGLLMETGAGLPIGTCCVYLLGLAWIVQWSSEWLLGSALANGAMLGFWVGSTFWIWIGAVLMVVGDLQPLNWSWVVMLISPLSGLLAGAVLFAVLQGGDFMAFAKSQEEVAHEL